MTNTPASRSLHRSDNRVIAGVCSGVAEYLGIDTTLVRILVVVFTIFGGAAVPIYLVAWAIIPDTRGDMIATRMAERLAAKRPSSGEKLDVPNPYPTRTVTDDTTRDTTHEPPAA